MEKHPGGIVGAGFNSRPCEGATGMFRFYFRLVARFNSRPCEGATQSTVFLDLLKQFQFTPL